MVKVVKERTSLAELIESVVTRDPVARKVARAAKLDDRLGQLAYDGQFASAGIIASSYQDHGVGRNLLKYKAVGLYGYPYGLWVYNNFAQSDRELVYIGVPVEQDTVALSGDLNVATPYRVIMLPQSGFELNVPEIFSAYCYLGYDADVNIRVRQAATYDDALTVSGTQTTIATGATLSGAAGQIVRPTVAFTPTQPYLRFEFQTTRTGGGLAGTSLKTAHWFNFMQEAVAAGQTQPSKFVLPIPNRGDFAANLIEADALKGYISGLGVSYTSSTTINVSAGAAYIPGLARIVRLPAGVDITPVMSTTARHYYVYLYEDASGIGQIEVVTTVPGVYQSTARQKSGDSTRRYLGAINNTLTPSVRRFEREGNFLLYTDSESSEQVVGGSAATTNTTVNCSPYAPPGILTLWVVANGYSTASANRRCFLARPGGTLSPNALEGQAMVEVYPNQTGRYIGWIRCDSVQDLQFAWNGINAQLYMYVRGYLDER